ncbi:MAG: alpha/beta hydrolase [Myxococcota bacterium]
MRALHELIQQVDEDPARGQELVEAFVSAHTFPYTEGSEATFFFYDGADAEQVKLLHWVFGLESHLELRKMPHVPAFWLRAELPLGGRVEYKFAVVRGGRTRLMRDPHNPHQAFDPFGSNSVCPMPGYTEPAWARSEEGVRQGELERFHLQSTTWGDTRRVDVYLPAEYRPTKAYPLLVVFDGDDYRKFASIRVVLDNLIHRHEVQPLIVAFTSGVNRNAEYAANPRQATFVAEELLPELRRRFSIEEGPEQIGLCGASFGGVTSLYTAWRYPDHFGKLLLQSGSFAFSDVGQHDLAELWEPVVDFVTRLRANPSVLNQKIYMSCGVFEGLIAYNRAMVPVLREQGLQVRYVEAKDGHNWIAWRDRLREGLTFLFPGYLWMTYE